MVLVDEGYRAMGSCIWGLMGVHNFGAPGVWGVFRLSRMSLILME